MTSINAIRIPADSLELEAILIEDSDLQACYRELGCSAIETVTSTSGVVFLVDEEGLLQARPQLNIAASVLAMRLGASTQGIVGTALIIGGLDSKLHGITQDQQQLILQALHAGVDENLAGSIAEAVAAQLHSGRLRF